MTTAKPKDELNYQYTTFVRSTQYSITPLEQHRRRLLSDETQPRPANRESTLTAEPLGESLESGNTEIKSSQDWWHFVTLAKLDRT
jgi:hypothetical protein